MKLCLCSGLLFNIVYVSQPDETVLNYIEQKSYSTFIELLCEAIKQ